MHLRKGESYIVILPTLQGATGKKTGSHKSRTAAAAAAGVGEQQQQKVPATGDSGGESDGKCRSNRELCRGVSLRPVAWRASPHKKLLIGQNIGHVFVWLIFSLLLFVAQCGSMHGKRDKGEKHRDININC